MIKISIAQIELNVGDLSYNMEQIIDARTKAIGQGADIVVFPEMTITGYPPEDLVLLSSFQQDADIILQKITDITSDGKTAIILGSLTGDGDKKPYNSAFLLADGKIQYKQHKYDLPNYGVFDESRVFQFGEIPSHFEFKGVKIGLMICEDMWNMYLADGLKNSDILISINGSPFEIGKHGKRLERARCMVEKLGKPLIYVNQICAQDDLVFDGDSFVLDHLGEIMVNLSRDKEEITLTEWESSISPPIMPVIKVEKKELSSTKNIDNKKLLFTSQPIIRLQYESNEMIYKVMAYALKQYVERNGFSGVLIGMSGGVDSALSAAIAVDALGADNVRLIMMPSRYTSAESVSDAQECADMLNVELENIPIEPMFESFEDALAPSFSGLPNDLTEENMQARIRATILMAMSNKFNFMLLATGNKSEIAVGYGTLYGDMCGGYNVLKDIYKTKVFELANWRNRNFARVIPQNIIDKEPSAELSYNQKDSDSLPDYDILDQILQMLIEDDKSIDDIINAGFEADIVQKTAKMLYRAEYKRRQSPTGVKISTKPFSRDRRYPITNAYV